MLAIVRRLLGLGRSILSGGLYELADEPVLWVWTSPSAGGWRF